MQQEETIYADGLEYCPYCGGGLEIDAVGTGLDLDYPSMTCQWCYSTFPFKTKPKPKPMDDDPDIPFRKEAYPKFDKAEHVKDMDTSNLTLVSNDGTLKMYKDDKGNHYVTKSDD